MPWFKADDGLPDHRKVRRAGTAAMGLWVLAGAWSARNLTDGFVPREIAKRWDPRGSYARRLVTSELWIEAVHHGENGFQFHDWEGYQPMKAVVEAEREAARERMKKKRAQRKTGDRSNDVQANTERSSESVREPRPDPTPSRPDPTSSSEDLGRRVTESNAQEPPSPKCIRHRNEPHPPRCGACADARRARADWDEAHGRAVLDQAKAKRAAISSCPDCDEAGWIIGSEPVVRCGHEQRRTS
ncbi:hypothetical protein [Rhodococcus sp. B10]|uniref:hypothetical protein n=1 Tax=Rhodococcus sp. B10 TaxID=2695876 RepID=UPI0014306BED|nr:hypothetical protein [Rhodococcus sp. B10]NIL77652.1 hypothetical protein [Rhodococcus sp. B10]